MKKIFLLFVGTLIMCFLFARPSMSQTLVIHHADGTITDVELYTRPVVTFQEDKILISSPVLSMEYPKVGVCW